MPNILQSLSLNSGLKINKVKPQEEFYPIDGKYITIHNSSDMGSKNYDYWLDVIEYIKPILSDIEIVAIGKECAPLPNTKSLVDRLTFNQTNYVLRNSLLHIGNDSYLCHLAGVHGIPIVALYGPTSPDSHGPHFGENKKLIESHRDGKKPSYSEESPKTINYIKPEDVANEILDSLNFGKPITDKTIFIGDKYGQQYIEVVPDCVVHPNAIRGQVPTMRCDYHYDEKIMAQNLSQSKFSIINDRETNIDFYKQFRQNIQNINFKVNENSNLDYIKKLRNVGIEVRFWTDDKETINGIRFKMLDIDLVHLVEYKEFEIDVPEDAKYRSFKIILSNGKIFPSKDAWVKGNNVSGLQEFSQVGKKTVDFKNEMEYFRIIC